jgi:hypothetical protein
VVGSKPPYLTAIYDLNADLVGEGMMIYLEALLRADNYFNKGHGWDGLDYGRETVTL